MCFRFRWYSGQWEQVRQWHDQPGPVPLLSPQPGPGPPGLSDSCLEAEREVCQFFPEFHRPQAKGESSEDSSSVWNRANQAAGRHRGWRWISSQHFNVWTYQDHFFLVPQVLRICTQFIEEFGIINGIYRASGISSNIQRIKLVFQYNIIFINYKLQFFPN